ncbi:DUF6266 family protein [Pedobacter cryoconitis]|uniref:Uncharacterized protein n=1 Tax=Pedobacter cryoconitis TaxID=188932 RepID=A0A7X0J3V1_9SPHI|nr:DUF6266 family protein [Pedobacter cryoconitis]MBB6500545.1 hypothetical protein [Pedobacter cryoconitis]
MAILKQGSIGVFTGKIGALVIVKWKDKYVGKSKPKSVSKKTAVLLDAQQSKFRIAGKFLRMVQSVVHFSFQKVPKKMNAMNYAMLYNLKHSISGMYPDFGMDYARVKLSEPADYTTEIDNGFNVSGMASGKKIKISWEADELPEYDGTKPTDRIYSFIYHHGKKIFINPIPPQRSELGLEVNLPSAFDNKVHVWIFFASEDHKFVSQTQYLGEFNVEN